jgi:hypothetical protein
MGSPQTGAQDRSHHTEKTLPDDVVRFLTQLAQAVQKFAMYPQGHPALESVADSVCGALEEVLARREVFSVGVGSSQLVVEDGETADDNDRFRGLAGRLHRHQLSAFSFTRGIGHTEVTEFLDRVSEEPERSEHPIGLTPPSDLPPWRHLRLQPIHYERLGLSGGEPAGAGPGGNGAEAVDGGSAEVESGAAAGSAASAGLAEPLVDDGADDRRPAGPLDLWRGLARAALLGHDVEQLSGLAGLGQVRRLDEREEPEDVREEAELLARALSDYASDSAYAEEILERLLELSQSLRSADPRALSELRRRTSLLVSLVEPEALGEMLRSGGDTQDRVRLLLDACHWMEAPAVVKLVRATAGAEGRDISHWLLLMLSKLASHATHASPGTRQESEEGLREQIEMLVANWALEDAVPEEYAEVLEQLSAKRSQTRQGATEGGAIEPERILTMSLELGEMGDAGTEALGRMLQAGNVGNVVAILSQTPDSKITTELWRQLDNPDTVRQLLEEDPPNFVALDSLIERLGVVAAEPMLDVLANAESRSTRSQVFSRLVRVGPDLAFAVAKRLDDRRWFVKRNMLSLLGEFDRWPRNWTPIPYAEHSHPAVRREALKLMLERPELADRAVCTLLQDADHRNLTLGLASANEATPPEAVPLLSHLSQDENQPGDVRLAAVHALGARGGPEAIECLITHVRGRQHWFDRLLRRVTLAKKSPLMLEALEALHRCSGADPLATRLLQQAAKSRDDEIRAATRGTVEEMPNHA